jgi:hypothetical protein
MGHCRVDANFDASTLGRCPGQRSSRIRDPFWSRRTSGAAASAQQERKSTSRLLLRNAQPTTYCIQPNLRLSYCCCARDDRIPQLRLGP